MDKEEISSDNSDNQKENGSDDLKNETEEKVESTDLLKQNEEQLLKCYKEKCELLEAEIQKTRDKCSDLEAENIDLKYDIQDLKPIIKEAIEIKAGLEEMGVNVDELLKIDLN